ncbi:Hsp20/alpha crystallin family protein [Micromonospora sp. NPDC048930]|uniref:Hsp20/alpha crystallin family protein n=1 Tax=Micromonospora sp. NPDC048930 TaxID=3364261 RepID=UPI00371CD074
MALMKWDPFTALAQLDSTFDELIRRNFGVQTQRFVPSVDMATEGTDVVIRMELPGITPDDVDIEVAGGVLTVSGERKDSVDSNNGRVLVRELRYGSFRRSFQLPDGVDADRVTAEFDNGVLKVRVKDVAAPVEQPRKIAIRSAGGATGPKQIEGETVETPAERKADDRRGVNRSAG